MEWEEAIDEARVNLGFDPDDDEDFDDVIYEAKRILSHNKRKEHRDYLSSPEWKIFRVHIIQRDMAICQDCGGLGHHVHHINYENLGQEEMDDCILLCRKCHGRRHWLLKRKRTTYSSGAVKVEKLKYHE